ncbi:hypothetical protein R1flu_020666 [Riccia fluitans]|uniref:Uncharacterized protein n=1 Tax=Riccia fluitans TaxID=41844 RepID=A0ABD1ZM54_9MARC
MQALENTGLELIPEQWGRPGCYNTLMDLVLKRAETASTMSDMMLEESKERKKANACVAEVGKSAVTLDEEVKWKAKAGAQALQLA